MRNEFFLRNSRHMVSDRLHNLTCCRSIWSGIWCKNAKQRGAKDAKDFCLRSCKREKNVQAEEWGTRRELKRNFGKDLDILIGTRLVQLSQFLLHIVDTYMMCLFEANYVQWNLCCKTTKISLILCNWKKQMTS